MADFSPAYQSAPMVHHVVHHAAPHYAACVQTGVSHMVSVISSVVAAGIGFGLGWYIKGRGMAGVQIDLNNVKNDVANLKARVTGATTPAA